MALRLQRSRLDLVLSGGPRLVAETVLLHEEDKGRWLSCPFDDAVALAQPYPSQLMGVDR